MLWWSPDARRIVFQGSSNDQIEILDLGAGEIRTLDTGQFPTWSLNGRYITYRGSAGRYVLYDLQTSRKTSLLGSDLVSRDLVWSPDGRYLVYAKLSSGVWDWMTGVLSASDTYGDLYVLDVQSEVESRLYRYPGSLYPTDWGKIEMVPGVSSNIKPTL
jgi:Tol biopolymer transport system component